MTALEVGKLTKYEIIDTIAKQKMVEGIIHNVAGYEDTLNDLAQEIYIDLLSKDEDKLIEMYDNKQLKFYIARIVTNNIFSKTSPYYTTYKKNKYEDIDSVKNL